LAGDEGFNRKANSGWTVFDTTANGDTTGGTIAFQNEILWSALAKTDLIIAPPGHTEDEAGQVVRSTHIAHGE
jgi:hypothetical protein